MTSILFAGGEDSSFPAPTSFTWDGGGNLGRSAFCRGSMNTYAVPGTSVPPAILLPTPLFTPTASLWVHGIFGFQSTNMNTTLNAPAMRVLDATGVPRIVVRGTGTAGQFKISTCNAAGTFTDIVTSAAGAMTASPNPVAIDLFVDYASSGQATLYVNGTAIADTGTGVNLLTDSATLLAQADFERFDSNYSYTIGWSEIIVATTSTLGMALFTMPPVAAGNTQSWTPNTVGNIDEVPINDANSISTASDNALSEWTVPTTLPSGIWAIQAIVQEARVSVGASGPQHFEWLVRTSDGTDHVAGDVGPTTSLANYSYIWPENPQTAAPWNAGELINIGIESLV